jgi:hypothetical protein
MACVKVNRTDYIDVHKIVSFSVYRVGQYHLYVKFEGVVSSCIEVDDYHLGNIIDYLYQTLGMEAEDYAYLDNLYGWAAAQEQDNNDSAGEGEE